MDKKRNIFYIVILGILIGVCALYIYLFGSESNTPLPVPSEEVSNTEIVDDPSLGFSIKLPPDFSIENNGQFSRLLTKDISASPTGVRDFLYISIVPLAQEHEEGSIYNYSKSDYEKLLKTQIGDRVILGSSTDQNLNSYFTYTRGEGAMIGGYGASEYVNIKPWEFPEGTTEYRYIIPFSSAAYIIGGYIGQDITKNEFDEIIATLELKPNDINLIKVDPVAEGEWKTYRDTANGISFQYPSNWKQLENSQFFENGDIFAIQAIGQTQRPQTELYDGVNFAVMRPVPTNMETLEWMKSRYDENEPVDSSRPPVYESVSYGGIRYEKVTVCGLGCFPYYYTKQNGKIYGFLGFAAGPNEKTYQEVIGRILSSVTYF